MLSRNGLNTAESRDQARGLEDEMYKQATTIERYHELIDKVTANLQPQEYNEVGPVVSAEQDEILNVEGPSLGQYDSATFHTDGQMSTIFKARARQPVADKIVALKVTHPSSMGAPHDSVREARILRECSHEHVVQLIESFHEPGGRFVLVFPFLRQDLENLMRSGSLSKAQATMVFRGLFDALTYIHSRGIIHRDVKPSNILLRNMTGPAYLADFGIAWSPNDRDSEPADSKITDVGTTSYRPPELLFGHQAYDTSLDMWAAGCVVGEMMKSDHYPLFDAGPLGSELGLIKSIFTTLGTPNDQTWPSAQRYPDWNKMRFQQFEAKTWNEILPGAPADALDFVSKTVCYESTQRLTAAEALKHPLKASLAAA